MPSYIGTYGSFEQLKSSLEAYASRELSTSSDVFVFVPFYLQSRNLHPEPKTVAGVAAALTGLGHKVTVGYNKTLHPEVGSFLTSEIKTVDLTRDHYVFAKGIGQAKVTGWRALDKTREPLLSRVAVTESSYEAEGIIPVLSPTPSASFILNGSMTAFLSLLPSQTIGKIMLEAVTNKAGAALSEVYSLFSFKVLGAIYDLGKTLDWQGNGKGHVKEKDSALVFAEDPVAGDAYICELFGWPSLLPGTIRGAMDLASGNGFLKDVDFEGRLRKGFLKVKRPITDRNQLFYPLSAAARFRLIFDKAFCNRCFICQNVCPNGSIKLTGDGAEIEKTCIYCFACVDNCPRYAIMVKRIP